MDSPKAHSGLDRGDLDIVTAARALAAAVARLVTRARAFFYEVVLAGHTCPRCAGRLQMRGEGRCACTACGQACDPTVAFQECSACGGRPRVRIRRYACARCGRAITSRFLFDGLVFDAAYFREKMAASRQRRQERRVQLQQFRSASHSGVLEPLPVVLDDVPDLIAVLNRLTAAGATRVSLPPREQFSLQRYETHVQAHLGTIAIRFDEIPPLSENTLYDRVWRFIALLFLAQAGVIRVWQEHETIWLMSYEADREGQAVPRDVADAAGIAGPVG